MPRILNEYDKEELINQIGNMLNLYKNNITNNNFEDYQNLRQNLNFGLDIEVWHLDRELSMKDFSIVGLTETNNFIDEEVTNRLSYTNFDIILNPNYMYRFEVETEKNTERLGMFIINERFYQAGIGNPIDNKTIYADDMIDPDWQELKGYEIVLPNYINGYPVKCIRFTIDSAETEILNFKIYKKYLGNTFCKKINNKQNSDFTIMSFNCSDDENNGIYNTTNYLNYLISQYTPSVIGHQEANRFQYETNLNYDSYNINTVSDDISVGSKCVLCVSNNFSQDSYSEVKFEAQTTYARHYQKKYINYRGKRIAIYNTHLNVGYQEMGNYPIDIKWAEAQELFEAVKEDEYFIVMGDFNYSGNYKNTDYNNMYKLFADYGCNMANCDDYTGFYSTWMGSWDSNIFEEEVHDNIITSSNISIDEVIIDRTKLEQAKIEGLTTNFYKIDHLPLIVKVSLK